MKRLLKQNKKVTASLIVVFSFTLSLIGLRFVNALASPSDSVQPGAPVVQSHESATKTSYPDITAAKKDEVVASAAKADTAQASASNPSAPNTSGATAQKATYAPIAAASPKNKSLYVDASLKIGQPSEIASQPTSVWLGEWNANVKQTVNASVSSAVAQGSLSSFVMYNIPARDCGSYSAGGASSSQAYRAWVRSVAAGIGMREAIVIVEPDALSQITCLSTTDQETRYADIADAVNVLATQTKAYIYLDAGNSSWIDAATMVGRLEKANVAQARGFSMNVSGFQTTSSTVAYGEKISAKNGKSYVIDTSRNGQGPKGNEWCNPSGRGLGKKPSTVTSGNLDAYLWVKVPGESDGECNNGPSAGTWWPSYAQELINNAVY